ncbi:MAG: hypothetical protein FJZ05_00065 [Candidatus Nealsonbacteria bacterium]|nr:hypothetical protein [Candidatus Nealsonbacteria bacterium]
MVVILFPLLDVFRVACLLKIETLPIFVKVFDKENSNLETYLINNYFKPPLSFKILGNIEGGIFSLFSDYLREIILIKNLYYDRGISDWKTYKNEEYGFEVKYPQDWFVEGYASNVVFGEKKTVEVEIIPGEYQNTPLSEIGFSVRIFPNIEAFFNYLWVGKKGLTFEKITSLNDWALKIDEILDKENGEEIVPFSFGINNYKGFKVTLYKELGVPSLFHQIVVQNNGFIYNIQDRVRTAQSAGFTKYNYDEVFNQILSTFKFLD